MANRTVIKMFRCTPSEAEEITRMAAENKISESDFIRKKIFWLSPDTDELLTKLEHYDLKIGTNINQIVRSCNSKKFITNQDYKELVRLLENLVEKRYEVIRQMKERNEKIFLSETAGNSGGNDKNEEIKDTKETVQINDTS
ncbi:MAG: MobC family plasmid mobilization relaxosome protein [Clostridiales bacterium]|nr:MobC family plasmid mobilization relaxosome protein [Clostridiales bacterium]